MFATHAKLASLIKAKTKEVVTTFRIKMSHLEWQTHKKVVFTVIEIGPMQLINSENSNAYNYVGITFTPMHKSALP